MNRRTVNLIKNLYFFVESIHIDSYQRIAHYSHTLKVVQWSIQLSLKFALTYRNVLKKTDLKHNFKFISFFAKKMIEFLSHVQRRMCSTRTVYVVIILGSMQMNSVDFDQFVV